VARWVWTCLLFTACSGRSCEPAPRDPAVLILGTTQEPDTIDPAFTQSASGLEIMRLLFRDLTELDAAWRLVPSLAAELPRVETSSAGPRVNWRLRPGLLWSDGHPLSAQDLEFGWRLERRPELPTLSHPVAMKVRELRATSPTELTVVWQGPYADFRAPRVHAILPAHAYPPIPSAGVFRGFGKTQVVGSGPFRLQSWSPGRQLTVEANPHWAGQKPGLDRIQFRFYTSEDALEAGLLAGEIDGTVTGSGLSLERAEALKARLLPERIVEWSGSGAWLHLELRLDDPWLAQRGVREAIDRAIDRSVLIQLVYGGHGVPAAGLFPRRHPAHRPRAPTPLDLEGAKARVMAATPNDTPLRLQFGAGNLGAERAATYVAAQLQKIGLPVELEPLPSKVLIERMEARSQAGLVLYNWRSRPDWDGRSLLHSQGRQNAMGLRSAAVDQALDAAAETMDPVLWAEKVAQAEFAALAELPVIPLAFREEVTIRPRRLTGFQPTGAGPTTWNAEAWRLDASAGP
jgi:peptide/nickel transport system substrate-binding protein